MSTPAWPPPRAPYCEVTVPEVGRTTSPAPVAEPAGAVPSDPPPDEAFCWFGPSADGVLCLLGLRVEGASGWFELAPGLVLSCLEFAVADVSCWSELAAGSALPCSEL